MAKPYEEITKSKFRENYNVVKILNDKQLIMKQLQTFNPNNQAVAFGVRKQHKLTLEDRVSNIESHITSFDDKLDLILQEIKSIKRRLDKHDELFKSLIELNNLKH